MAATEEAVLAVVAAEMAGGHDRLVRLGPRTLVACHETGAEAETACAGPPRIALAIRDRMPPERPDRGTAVP